MKQIDNYHFKTMMLDVLSSIHNFCEEHSIKYFLAYGSLIGAVRHQGFIPWDDDIDIWMPRPDYNHFMKEFKHPYLKILSIDTNHNYPLEFNKVHDSRTIVIEQGGDGDWGIFIDIFPMDGVPSSKEYDIIFRKISIIRHLVGNQRFTKNLRISLNRSIKKNILAIIGKIASPFLSLNKLLRKQTELMSYFNFDSCLFVTDFDIFAVKYIIPKEAINETVLVDFEDRKFYIPKDYDTVLKTMYGDYMKLPSPEHRVSNHGIKAYWKD